MGEVGRVYDTGADLLLVSLFYRSMLLLSGCFITGARLIDYSPTKYLVNIRLHIQN